MEYPRPKGTKMASVTGEVQAHDAHDVRRWQPQEILMAIFDTEVAGMESLREKSRCALVCKEWNTQYVVWLKQYLEGANLLCAGSLEDAVEKRDIAGLTAGMQKYRLVVEVQSRGCQILLHLLTQYQPTRMRVLVGEDGLRAVHGALVNHHNNSDVCMYGMGALYHMCPANEVKNVAVVHKSQMQRTVLEILCIPNQKANVVVDGVRFLFHWSPEVQTNVDKIHVLFRVMKDMNFSVRVQLNCMITLHNTLHEAHSNGVDVILETSDIATVMRTMQNQIYSQEIMHFACLVVIEILPCAGAKDVLLSLQAVLLMGQIEKLYAHKSGHVQYHAYHCRQLLTASNAASPDFSQDVSID